ncbi:ketopantoate reductase family protein [Ruicaihuangia caeni]|uniref:ketopantoate reductase family protein n=1 Tax=Ruicaihuangia caeni TaxID=3042517 RepID=UPI00338E9613
MRVGVVGAGAMGGAIAAMLERAGNEVWVAARGEHLTAIRRDGLKLDGAWGEYTARVSAAKTLPLKAKPELVIIATKAMDAEAAARDNARAIGDAPTVVLQNGLGGMERVAEQLPGSPIVGALSMIAASYVAPGHVRVTTAANTVLGAFRGTQDADAAELAASALNAAGMPAEVIADFEGAQWTKLIVNQVNALPAITGLSVQEVISHAGLRRIMTASMREAVRVGLARGVRFAAFNGLTHARLSFVARAPLSLGQMLPLRIRAYLGATPNPGSTLQSIRRGRRSEIDFLNGAVVAAAQGTEVPVPVNTELLRLVHEVETSGQHLSVRRVIDRVTAATGPLR